MNSNNFKKRHANLPKNLKMEIMKHLTGKHKRVYARVYGLELPRKPKSQKTVRWFRYNNTKRFNNRPTVYKDPNWKYFLIQSLYNRDISVPIFFNRVNNIPNNYLELHYNNNRLLPWQAYLINPRTGKKRYIKNEAVHIRGRSRDPPNFKKRDPNRNTWNAYLRRT